MKFIPLFLSVLVAAQAAEISVTAQPSYSAVVCAMTVCPTATALASRDIECPDYCNGKCKVVDDLCCPGVQKVVCDEVQSYNGTVTVGSSSSPMVSAFTSSAASSTPTAVSTTDRDSSLPSATSSGAAQATQSPPSSGAESNSIALGSMCLMMLCALTIQAL
ncbi:hypothetical protein BD560DRAFT_388492 [Blakeslea trispora]|nr:hypothetical protein BD560DRAFT_388492 [Blakeslea trispora]